MSCARAPSSLGKLRALVESGQGGTTLFELGSGIVLQAKKLGLIEKLDWAAINPAPMFPEAKNEYGFGYQYFSTIMAWRKGAKEPQNFVEFFDTKAFPGKRTLPDYPHYCLPFALQAAGVPIDKLFPLDVDLAFKKLNEIKKDVAVWWKAGAQPPQLMKDNEVQYAICWSGRVVGDPAFGLSFAGGKADLSYIADRQGLQARGQGGREQALLRDVAGREPGQGGAGHLLHRSQPRPRCAAAQGQALAIPDQQAEQGHAVFRERRMVGRERRGREQEVGGLQAQPVRDRPMRGQGFAFIAPLLVLMVVAFNLPIIYMLGLAFWDKGRGFTLEHYEGCSRRLCICGCWATRCASR